MNTNKLADYVGVPRSTMDLEELERSAESSEGAQPGSNLYAYHVKVVRNKFSRKLGTKRPVTDKHNAFERRLPIDIMKPGLRMSTAWYLIQSSLSNASGT